MKKKELIYHLRVKSELGSNIAICNKNRSQDWIKYSDPNFNRGKTFNYSEGKEVLLDGKPCKRCIKLSKSN